MKDQHIGFQIVGYTDERRCGDPVILSEPKLGRRKLLEAWAEIKPGHRFPKGVKSAVLVELREADSAVFISDTIAGEQDAANELRAKREKESDQKKIDAAKAKKQLADAAQAVRDKAVARDAANFELAAAKSDLNTAKSNATETESNVLSPASKKLFQSRLETAELRLKKSTEAFASADKAWLDAKDGLAKLNQQNLTA